MLLSLVRGFEKDNFQRIDGKNKNFNGKDYRYPALIDLSKCKRSVKIDELKAVLGEIVEGNEMSMKADIYLMIDQINAWQSVK